MIPSNVYGHVTCIVCDADWTIVRSCVRRLASINRFKGIACGRE